MPGQETNRLQKGVGLVEVLVALLVFSVGMLGVASLQVLSRKSSFEAQQRQEAVLLANEMVARMKSSGLSFAQIKESANYGDITITAKLPEPTPPCNTIAANCNAAEIADWDTYAWSKSIAAAAVSKVNGKGQGLLNAKGCVTYVPADFVINVVVAWDSMTDMGVSAMPPGCTTGGGNKQRHVIIRTTI